jgi:hypothetical protein
MRRPASVRGIVSVSLCWFFVGTQRQLTFRAARWRCSRSLSWPNPPQTAIPRGTFFFSQASAELEKGEERDDRFCSLSFSPLRTNPWRNHSIRFKLTANCNSNISSSRAIIFILQPELTGDRAACRKIIILYSDTATNNQFGHCLIWTAFFLQSDNS